MQRTPEIEFYLMVIKHAWYDKNEFDIIISVYMFQKPFKVNVSILGSIATIYYASILVIQSIL